MNNLTDVGIQTRNFRYLYLEHACKVVRNIGYIRNFNKYTLITAVFFCKPITKITDFYNFKQKSADFTDSERIWTGYGHQGKVVSQTGDFSGIGKSGVPKK